MRVRRSSRPKRKEIGMRKSGASRRVLFGVALLLLAALPVVASEADEASSEILLETLRSNRKAFVAANLSLSDEEAKAFWPVYDRYQQEMNAVGDRLLGVIDTYRQNFGKLSDQQATELVQEYLAVERDRVAVRRSYLEPISAVLPGRKVMRFYQLENKIDAVLRYDLAATIPVVEP
jgi:hypothetical protein